VQLPLPFNYPEIAATALGVEEILELLVSAASGT
jgi:hypothetical protein